MKLRLTSILLGAMLLMGIFAGCTAEPPATTSAPETTQPATVATEAPVQVLDLEALYNEGMEVLAQLGDRAPVLFPETDINYLNIFYPGLADIELKQLYAGVAPVTNAPFEIILVEVADEADVQAVREIFQGRVDRESGDSTYPENAEAWINNCRITSRGW